MSNPPLIKVIGSYLSPYVRKVLVCLEIKGLSYEIDPIIPFYGNSEFNRVSPLRRIPVLMDDQVTLADSTVICEYLDERYPGPALMPKTVQDRARARWLEEYADSRMGEVFIWHLYNQLVIKRFVWGLPADEAVLAKALNTEIPQVMDYLEATVPSSGYLFNEISVADITLASFFRNAAFARYHPDSDRWPIAASYLARVLSHPGFQKLIPFEECLLRTPIPEHRTALKSAGAPISAETYGAASPQPGILAT